MANRNTEAVLMTAVERKVTVRALEAEIDTMNEMLSDPGYDDPKTLREELAQTKSLVRRIRSKDN
jgi:hypothetical protein